MSSSCLDVRTNKPSLNETSARKRIFLKYRLPSNNDYTNLVPIFKHVLRLPDRLVQGARFRPEVLRKVKAARDAAVKQIQKADDESKAEERAQEREKEMKRGMKKQTTRA